MRKEDPRIDPEDAEALIKVVLETAGLKNLSPTSIDNLALQIFQKTGDMLSTSTLKRVTGYINSDVKSRISTFDILARYCGWQDYKHFQSGNPPEVESGVVGSRRISVEKDMKPGERIRLLWAPARVCIVEYLGELKWQVIESEGTRLQPGDTFKCALIIEGEPLYLDELIHAGKSPKVYVCGRRTGVTFVKDE